VNTSAWEWLTHDAAGFFTLGLVIIGAAQAFLFLVMKGTAERQLRAYLGVTARDVPNLAVGQQQEAGIFITNYGQTPAQKIRYWGDVIIRECPLHGKLPKLNFRKENFPVNPGQKVPIVFRANNPLTAAEEAALRSGTHRLYSYGVVEYFDVFKKRRTTTYRFEYGGERFIGMGQMAVSEKGNDQT
jgi:hypothetical protein